nr:immunoglobulin heavy chain junction region [Mus musculus]
CARQGYYYGSYYALDFW